MSIKPVQFPADHGAHKNIIEWWYFNGQLEDRQGNRYAFMDCLFKADIGKVRIPFLKNPFTATPYVHFAHSAISDLSRKKAEKDIQNISIVSRDSYKRDRLFVEYVDALIAKGFAVSRLEESEPDVFEIKTEKMSLRLKSRKPALLEGGAGHIIVCGRPSYYYSLTDLTTSGKICIGGKWIDVSGKSWFDHQWADVAYSKDRWTWFSVQLDNGTDLMLCEYDDGRQSDYLVDIIDAKGRQTHGGNLIIKPGKKIYRSQKTKAEYPMSFELELPDQGMKLEVESLMPDQEMIFGTINYWEGPTRVTATVGGKRVSGQGFMELVGYPSDYIFLLLAGKELGRSLSRNVRSWIKKDR